MMKYILITFFLLSTSFLPGQNCNDAIHNGEGTFYGGVAGSSAGNCSLPVANDDFMHCALNNFDYDNSNACGAFIELTGANGTVTLQVVDRCPECQPGDVDMTMQAFEAIANVSDGRVPITWRFVPGNLTESIKINFKTGSSQYWTAIQFRDIEHAIAKMEYKKDDGTWQTVNRELFNFFIEPAGITPPMTLRATSILGEELIFEDIPINLNSDIDTGQQFSTPPECTTTLSLDSFEGNLDFSIYPNPSSHYLNLKGKFKKWHIINLQGKELNRGSSKKIDISKLADGVYLLHIDQSFYRFIKRKS